MTITAEHAWLEKATCDASCVGVGIGRASRGWIVALRSVARVTLTLVMLMLAPLLVVPVPGRTRMQRWYFRTSLRCMGVRVKVTGGPIRNLQGVLVVSGHVSWLDPLVVSAVLPGSFVARADVVQWPVVGALARMTRTIPIDRTNLRRLPDVVDTVSVRLSAGHTVVAFPEATTWCGLAYGTFRPAMFQGAVDAARPVQPLRISYRHGDGTQSTVPSFVGEDSLLNSLKRIVGARLTVVHIDVPSLELPGPDRRDLARRCQAAVRGSAAAPVSVGNEVPRHELVA
ncbi:MAG: lysophospholipid acyltransferase family protein [Mycobacterium sp.]